MYLPAETKSAGIAICSCLCMWIDFHTFFQQFFEYLKINVAKVVSDVCIGIHYDADTVVCIVYSIQYIVNFSNLFTREVQSVRKRFL